MTDAFDAARLSERVSALEGYRQADNGRFNSLDARNERLTRLVSDVLAHSGAVQAEVLGALSRTEGEVIALRRVVEETALNHGALLRRLSAETDK